MFTVASKALLMVFGMVSPWYFADQDDYEMAEVFPYNLFTVMYY